MTIDILSPRRTTEGGYECVLLFGDSEQRIPYGVLPHGAGSALQQEIWSRIASMEANDPASVEPPPPPAPVTALRHQVEIWFDENGWPGGLENPLIVAAAAAAGGRAALRLRSAQTFASDDDLMTALAAALTGFDARAAMTAAAQIP